MPRRNPLFWLLPLSLLLTACPDTRKQIDFATDPSILRGTWQAEVGKVTGESVVGLAFAPDGSSFAAATSYGFDLYDTQTFTRTTLDLEPGQVSFSADGKRLGVSGSTVQVLDLETGKTLLNFDTLEREGEGYIGQLSPNFEWIASYTYIFGEEAKRVKVWSAATGQVRFVLEHPTPISDELTFSPDSTYLAVSDNSGLDVFVWNLKTGNLAHTFTNAEWNGSMPHRMLFTPDSRQLWVQWYGGRIDRWDLTSGARLETPPGLEGRYMVAFSRDGDSLLTTSPSVYVGVADELELLDLATGERRAIVKAPAAPFSLFNALFYAPPALSPDNRYIVASTTDGVVQVLDLQTERLLQSFPNPAPETLTLNLEATYLDDAHYGVSGTVTNTLRTTYSLQGEVDGGTTQKYLAPANYYAPIRFTAKTPAESGQTPRWLIDASSLYNNDETYTGYIEDGTLGTGERGPRRELKLERVPDVNE